MVCSRFKRRDFICPTKDHQQDKFYSTTVSPKQVVLHVTDANLFSCHGEGSVEPLVEGGHGLEDAGQQEVEERPELGEFVLEGRPCEEEAMGSRVVRVQGSSSAYSDGSSSCDPRLLSCTSTATIQEKKPRNSVILQIDVADSYIGHI